MAPASNARSQDLDPSCVTGLAEAYLNINNVRARLFNDGTLFWRGAPHVYEVPKGGGASAIFSAAIWLTGMVDDSLRVAATTYGPAEYWPGPLADDGSPPVDCAKYDRIWSMDRSAIEEYERTGRASLDLAEWPTGLGAPTLDAAGNIIDAMQWPFDQRRSRTIALEDGERPFLLGDQMHWWIMNDAGGEHRRTGTAPIGVEVQITAFAHSGAGAIANATFYRLQMRKPAGSPLKGAHFGLYADTDVGNGGDDYVGSDSLLGLAYAYNGDNDDGTDRGSYGTAPPAVGIDFLRGPLVEADGIDNDRDGVSDEDGERLSMTTAKSRWDEHGSAWSLHNNLRGLWWDGRPMTEGGNGIDFSATPSPWMFSGNPPAYWSELDTDGSGTPSPPAWRQLLAGMGPFELSSEEPQEILIGIITSFGRDNIDSVRQLKEDDTFIQNLADSFLLDPPSAGESLPGRHEFAASFFPVPASERMTLLFNVPQQMPVRIEVFDQLGRQHAGLVDRVSPAGSHVKTFNVSTWTPGVYLARLQMGDRSFTRKLVVVR